MNNKMILLLVICLLSMLVLSGCMRKNYNLDEMKNYIKDNENELNAVAGEARRALDEKFNYIALEEGEWIISSTKEPSEYKVVSSDDEKYGKLILKATLVDKCKGIRLAKDNILLYMEDGGDYIMFSKMSIDDITCPFDAIDGVSWEKDIIGRQAIFVNDHRKDKTTDSSRMYYQLNIEKAGDEIYACHYIRKYPWYSYLIG